LTFSPREERIYCGTRGIMRTSSARWHAHCLVVDWQAHSNVLRTRNETIWEDLDVSNFWSLPAIPRRRRRWATNSRLTRWVTSWSSRSMMWSVFWRRCETHVFHLQFPALKSKHVYIRDKIAVLETINAIRQGGMNNLQVLLFTPLIRTSLWFGVWLIYDYLCR